MKKEKVKLITVDLLSLVGKNIAGLRAQVRNPYFLNKKYTDGSGSPQPMWRILKKVTTYKEVGRVWLKLEWEKVLGQGNDCGFTGCTRDSNTCQIQFTKEEFKKVQAMPGSKRN